MAWRDVQWAVLASAELTPAEQVFLIRLADCKNHETGLCCPRPEYLSKITGLSRSTIYQVRASLVDKCLISHTESRGRALVHYTLNPLFDAPEPPDPPPGEASVASGKRTQRSVESSSRTQNRERSVQQPDTNASLSPADGHKAEFASSSRTAAVQQADTKPEFASSRRTAHRNHRNTNHRNGTERQRTSERDDGAPRYVAKHETTRTADSLHPAVHAELARQRAEREARQPQRPLGDNSCS